MIRKTMSLLLSMVLLLSLAGLVLLIVRARRVRFAPGELELPREKRFSVVWCNPGMLLLLLVFIALCAVTVISFGM